MARRVPLHDVETAVEIIEQDGGVILTGFSSITDVDRVNSDAAPFLAAIKAEVSSRVYSQAHHLADLAVVSSGNQMIDFPHIASVAVSPTGNSTLHTPLRAQHHSARNLAPATAVTADPEPLPAHRHRTVQLRRCSGGDFRHESYSFSRSHAGHLSRREGATAASRRFYLAAYARPSTREIPTGVGRRDGSTCSWGEDKRCERSYVGKYSAFTAMSGVEMGNLAYWSAKLAQFVPGAHLWEHSRRPKLEEAVPASMEVGEAFLFLGSAVHAGGANTTCQSRTVHGFFFCRAYLRPEARILVLMTPFLSFCCHVHTDCGTGEPTSLVDQRRSPAVVCRGSEASGIPSRSSFYWAL